MDLLLGLRDEHGLTLLVATHHAAIAARSNRAIVLTDGLLVSDSDGAVVSVERAMD